MPTTPPPATTRRKNLTAFIKQILEINADTGTKERFCWILGAGCSFTSGIPTGKTLAREWLDRLHDNYAVPGESLAAFCTRLPQIPGAEPFDFKGLDPQNPGAHYSELYDFCFAESVQRGFSRLEQLMRGKDPSLGYSILARFLADTRHRVVITTNFDNLIADAISIHTAVFPLICGHESLVSFLELEHARPLVLKVHRDLLLNPMNRPAELERLHGNWRPALDQIFAKCTPIVLGYDGYDGTLMRYLRERDSLGGRFYWCHLQTETPRAEVHAVVNRHRGHLVAIDGFDEFMLRLGQPLGFIDPLTTMSQRFEQRKKSYTEQLDALTKRLEAKPTPAQPTAPPDAALRQAVHQIVQQAEQVVDWWAWEKKARAEKDPARRDQMYQAGIKDCPKSPELLGNYALFLHNIRKDYDRAETLYRKALELDPNHAGHPGNYAIFLKNIRKDYDRAETFYRKALELDPNHANNTGGYALFLHNIRKDYDRAETLYRKALELDPNHAINTGGYANFLKDIRKDYDRAETLYRKALELAPNDADYTANYAECLLEQKKWGAAAEQLQRAGKLAQADDQTLLPGVGYLLLVSHWCQEHAGPAWETDALTQRLGQLKYLLAQGLRSPTSSFDNILDALGAEWSPDRLRFARALADVVNDKAPSATLDSFTEWQAAPALPLPGGSAALRAAAAARARGA